MRRTAALIAGGLLLICAGVASFEVLESSTASPGREQAEREDSSTAPSPVEILPDPAPPGSPEPARRAGQAHPERRQFEPSTVRFADARNRDTAAVVPVDTERDGVLELPADPARMGWWTGGSQAGAPYGSVVLAGHLDSVRFGVGFSALMAELDVGEEVVLSDADQAQTYVVSKRYLQPRASGTALAGLFSDSGAPRLVLITCGGTYDRDAGAYSDNLVVEARPEGTPRRR